MNSTEICNILGISKENLKTIMRRQQLAARLLEHGYELIEIKKAGRANDFIVKQVATVPVRIETIAPKSNVYGFIKKYFPNHRKPDNVGIYLDARFIQEVTTKKDVAKAASLSTKTIESLDKRSEEIGLWTFNGYAYFRMTPRGPKQIPYSEYAEYWGVKVPTENTDVNTQIISLKKELKSIVEAEDDTQKDAAIDSIGVCVKVKIYLINRFTEIFNELEEALNNKLG